MSEFRVHIIASGSKGNATLLQAGDTAILIDAGISARRIKKGLAQAGVKPQELSGIFITHEHTDHINGLPVFCRHAQIPVFANERTWFASGVLGKIESKYRRMLPDDIMRIGDISLKPFSVSHDAAQPVGFNFFYRESKCSFATDMGFADASIREALSGSDTIVIEANHDTQMLANGSYPYYLKARIKGKRGHLSNQETGEILSDVIWSKQVEVFLAHLSQENNCPQIARKTVQDVLQQKGALQKAEIYIARQDELVSNCCTDEKLINAQCL